MKGFVILTSTGYNRGVLQVGFKHWKREHFLLIVNYLKIGGLAIMTGHSLTFNHILTI